MNKNIVDLAKRKRTPRVTYKGMVKAFRRVEVERLLEPVRAEEALLFPHIEQPPTEWFTARYDGPGEDYRQALLRPLRDLGIAPELLVYRVLRDLYGQPDNITVGLPKGVGDGGRDMRADEGPLMLEWGFMLQGTTDVLYEIRKQPGTQQPHLAVWLPRLMTVEQTERESRASEFKLLVREMKKTLCESQALVDKRDLKKASISVGPLNIYGDLLAAGDQLLEAADQLKAKDRVAERPRVTNERVIPKTLVPGTFFLAAAIQYLLALEAFINVVSELLRKEEFGDDLYRRLTEDVDFDSRLLSLALFCHGFQRQPFTPELQLFKRVRELRKFRNEVLHGSFSHDDHVIRMVPEDGYWFYWWPAVDGRAMTGDEASPQALPLNRTLFSKRHAAAVRRDVEAAIDAIIDAMQPEYKEWAFGWRHSLSVPALLSKQGWKPKLAGGAK